MNTGPWWWASPSKKRVQLMFSSKSWEAGVNYSMVIMCPQRKTWTWTTVSGKTSTLSLEPSRCSSVSCQNLCSPSAPSSRSWRPSVSNQHFVLLLQLLSVSASLWDKPVSVCPLLFLCVAGIYECGGWTWNEETSGTRTRRRSGQNR